MFEAVEFIEPRLPAGAPIQERVIDTYPSEQEAVAAARATRESFRQTEDYAWWIVREKGAQLARWIADNRSHKEFALDLTTGTLIEIPLI
jgi:predicted phage tail protein